MHTQSREYIVKVAIVVIDNGPTAAPTRKTVYFGEGTSADHWNLTGCVAKGNEGAFRVVTQTIVDLVSDNRNFELVCDGQNFFDMIGGKAGAARV